MHVTDTFFLFANRDRLREGTGTRPGYLITDHLIT